MLIKGKEIHKKYICILMAVVLVISPVFVGDITSKAAYRIGTVYGLNGTSTLNFREGPGTGYKAIDWLKNGENGEILEEAKASNGVVWYKMNVGGTIGWASSEFIKVTEYSQDDSFEVYLTKQGFPESYKEPLRKLHAMYPNWVFEAQHTGLAWNTVIEEENVFGRSLISKKSISSWKSVENGAYNWTTGEWVGLDGGSWTAASREIIKYYMDPRNFLDDHYIFQFLKQSYDSTLDYAPGLTALFSRSSFWSGSFEENGATKNYVTTLIEAGAAAGVSPYTIASTVIVEQGWSPDSILTSGSTGYYNFYNIGAYEADGMSPHDRGIWYASQTDASTLRPWDTRTKAITGGAQIYAKNYIAVGQDTLYLKKFDVVPEGGLYWHQYMTNIQAAASEGKVLADAFWTAEASESTKTSSLKFKIPVYTNMPDTACPKPTGDGSPNYMLKSLAVDGYSLTPTFSMYDTAYDVIVPYYVESVNVLANAFDPEAKISGIASHKLVTGSNKIGVTVKAQNGDTRTYTINVVRQDPPANTPTPGVTSGTYKMNHDSKMITGVNEKISVANFVKGLSVTNGTVKVVGTDASNRTGYIGTGCKVQIYDNANQLRYTYEVIVYGDTDGDGRIYTTDYARIRKRILGTFNMSGSAALAADANKNGKIDIADYAQVRKQILGTFTIKQ